jgi:hypothetical protein
MSLIGQQWLRNERGFPTFFLNYEPQTVNQKKARNNPCHHFSPFFLPFFVVCNTGAQCMLLKFSRSTKIMKIAVIMIYTARQ